MHKLAIKLEGLEKRRRNLPVLHLAAGFILMAKTLDYIHEFRFQNTLTAIPFFLVAIASLVYGFKMRKGKAPEKYNGWLRLLQVGFFALLGILFLNVSGVIDEIIVFAYCAICGYLYFFEKKLFGNTYLQIDKKGIELPGDYSNQLLAWNKVKDVVARPDFITIFKYNNQYLQLELLNEETSTDLERINRFAKEQIQNN